MPAATDKRNGGKSAADAPAAAILLREVADHIAILTLNRPQQRNSLSESLIAALQSEMDTLSADANVRAIVLAANGPAFSSGHDLKELSARRADADQGQAYFAELMVACARMMQTVVMSPKPVIAAVEGIATAAGCQLVASCDLAVASETARFATPGVNIGLFCSTPMVALSRNIPRKRAMEMLLLGEMLDAKAAAEWGLVNRVVPTGEALSGAMELAQRIASKSPATVKIGKQAFYRQLEAGLGEAYEQAASVMVENMLYQDAKEGIDAFIEKRTPTWTGR
jgi:enoyl-CoA hydratase/carnithine racemase